MLSRELRRKLSKLASGVPPEPTDEGAEAEAPDEERASDSHAEEPPTDADSVTHPGPLFFPRNPHGEALTDLIGGEERATETGSFWLSEVDVEPRWAPSRTLWEQLHAPSEGPPGDLSEMSELGPEDLVFFDIETAGLMGACLFLAGAMDLADGLPVLRFFLARDYAEELPMLEAFGAYLSGFGAVVTYNGKSFDVPYLLDRGRYHGLRLAAPEVHLDLLHPARRRWKGRYEDCRLVTLERELLCRHRLGDVPSHLIPEVYHEFVASRDPGPLVPILQHNGLDLLSLAELLALELVTPLG